MFEVWFGINQIKGLRRFAPIGRPVQIQRQMKMGAQMRLGWRWTGKNIAGTIGQPHRLSCLDFIPFVDKFFDHMGIGSAIAIPVPDTAVSRANIGVEVGIHNDDGAEWMRVNGVTGWALHTIEVGTTPQTVDVTHFDNAGIKMLVRLNYGYNPKGNLPREDSPDYQPFIDACVETMRRSRGVWGYVFGNETNNPHEFPGGVNGAAISPEQYARAFNLIWARKPAGTQLGTQAIDPYFGPNSDSRDYWVRVLNNLLGADFLTVHPKTQDSNPDNVDSAALFANHPLTWQFLHLRSYQPLLDAVPQRFWNLPVIATEVNPQRFNDGQTLGWQQDQGAEWVKRAVAHFKAYNQNALMPVNGVIFYRFSQDDWAISNKQNILDAIKRVA